MFSDVSFCLREPESPDESGAQCLCDGEMLTWICQLALSVLSFYVLRELEKRMETLTVLLTNPPASLQYTPFCMINEDMSLLHRIKANKPEVKKENHGRSVLRIICSFMQTPQQILSHSKESSTDSCFGDKHSGDFYFIFSRISVREFAPENLQSCARVGAFIRLYVDRLCSLPDFVP